MFNVFHLVFLFFFAIMYTIFLENFNTQNLTIFILLLKLFHVSHKLNSLKTVINPFFIGIILTQKKKGYDRPE